MGYIHPEIEVREHRSWVSFLLYTAREFEDGPFFYMLRVWTVSPYRMPDRLALGEIGRQP